MEKSNGFAIDYTSIHTPPPFGRTVTFKLPDPNDIYHYTPIIRVVMPPIQFIDNQAPRDPQQP